MNKPACIKCQSTKRFCEYSTLGPAAESRPPNPESGSKDDTITLLQSSNFPSQTSPPTILKPVFAQSRESLASAREQEALHDARWNELSTDAKVHLTYFQQHMSHHHFKSRLDPTKWFKTTYLHIAMAGESAALLYGIVAFAAYHKTFDDKKQSPVGFLKYYNHSISLAQKSIARGQDTVDLLLALLQLATLEQRFGDWSNVVIHLNAARDMMTTRYTPKDIPRDETVRRIFVIYSNLDIYAGLMGGVNPGVPLDWYDTFGRFYKEVSDQSPGNIMAQLQHYSTQTMFITALSLFIISAKNELSDEEFGLKADQQLQAFQRTRNLIEAAFIDSSPEFVTKFPHAPPPTEADIVDYQDPKFLYSGELFPYNLVVLYIWTVEVVFRFQVIVRLPKRAPQLVPQMRNTGLRICKMYQALQYCDESPPGIIRISAQSMQAMTFVLGKEKKYIDWFCEQLGQGEMEGIIPVTSFRRHLSTFWDRDVTYWWRPGEEPPKIILAPRHFVETRDRQWAHALCHQVADMDGVFSGLSLED